MGKALDAAIAHLDCPIRTFEVRLTAFARANYAACLENTRCTDSDLTIGAYHFALDSSRESSD
jgi:hypothetical protein